MVGGVDVLTTHRCKLAGTPAASAACLSRFGEPVAAAAATCLNRSAASPESVRMALGLSSRACCSWLLLLILDAGGVSGVSAGG